MEAVRYVENGNENHTKKMLKSLFEIIFVGNILGERKDIEVGLMYDSLENAVKKKQKVKYIELALDEQKDYETNVNEKEICEKIKATTIRYIKEKFSSVIIPEDKKNGIIKIDLLKIGSYTKLIRNTHLDGCYSLIDEQFLVGIINFVKSRKVVELKERFNDFSKDKEFINYLSINNLHLLLGSQFIIGNTDYKISCDLKKFFKDHETIYAVINEGLALKKDSVQICLHDVNVSIHSPSIAESGATYDKGTRKYNYPITSGLPIDFERDELREFLYNKRKMINITAKVSIRVNEKPCGTIFTNRYDRYFF